MRATLNEVFQILQRGTPIKILPYTWAVKTDLGYEITSAGGKILFQDLSEEQILFILELLGIKEIYFEI